ncbi:MAG: pentapeptide repeat-containing protein [Deltaproteobacteria bacterium]|nr:pentapeptide repeat-containing protein [Deltaproteobacteria bacterium]
MDKISPSTRGDKLVQYSFFISILIVFVLILIDILLKRRSDYWENIFVEMFSPFLSILLVGFILYALNERSRKKSERRLQIQRYLDEIDFYKNDKSEVASLRILDCIIRLNLLGISKIDLTNCFLKNITFRNKLGIPLNLKKACFEGANLEYSVFNSVNLEEANLKDANIKHASFAHAILKNANMRNADIQWANFEYAKLENACLENIKGSSAILNNAILTGANMKNADLFEADVTNANFENADLENANLQEIQGIKVNFKESLLKGVNFKLAKLCGANFKNADLKEAKLYRANLLGAKFNGSSLSDTKGLMVDQLIFSSDKSTPIVKSLYKVQGLDPGIEKILERYCPSILMKQKTDNN